MKTTAKSTSKGIIKVLSPQVYGVEEISQILNVGTSKAYKVIADLRKDYINQGYPQFICPNGKIPIWFFNERGGFDRKKGG